MESGAPVKEAAGVLILIHGRGADASGMLNLADELKLDSIAYIAPEAENSTWYPYSFLEPVERNEPYLSQSLMKIEEITDQVIKKGVQSEKIFYLGFSQGACLTLEHTARYPRKYGGIFAFSGALIGKPNRSFDYEGSLKNTPVFLGCSDIDPHIPLERLNSTETILSNMGAEVTKRIYPGMGHTINREEFDYARKLLVDKLFL